jgi:hypothetical protein
MSQRHPQPYRRRLEGAAFLRTIVFMDPLRYLAETRGFFTRAEARDCGCDDKVVARSVKLKIWFRVRRGGYTFTDIWSQLDAEDRHRVRSAAVMHSLGRNVALSHVSGVVDWEIPTWGLDLSRVHVTRLDGGPGRLEGDVVHHEGVSLDHEVVEREAHNVLIPERCVLEAGSRARTPASRLVIVDGLLRMELATHDRLLDQFTLMARWPFMRSMHLSVRMADGDAGSPGESLGRHLFWASHIPAPQLQYEVREPSGTLLGTCDWGWPELGALGEFDGRFKYGRLLKEGQDPGDVVFAEKQREDLIREATDYRMVRIIWSDYDRPRLTARRVREKLRRIG